jgi:hypothetical protein
MGMSKALQDSRWGVRAAKKSVDRVVFHNRDVKC